MNRTIALSVSLVRQCVFRLGQHGTVNASHAANSEKSGTDPEGPYPPNSRPSEEKL